MSLAAGLVRGDRPDDPPRVSGAGPSPSTASAGHAPHLPGAWTSRSTSTAGVSASTWRAAERSRASPRDGPDVLPGAWTSRSTSTPGSGDLITATRLERQAERMPGPDPAVIPFHVDGAKASASTASAGDPPHLPGPGVSASTWRAAERSRTSPRDGPDVLPGAGTSPSTSTDGNGELSAGGGATGFPSAGGAGRSWGGVAFVVSSSVALPRPKAHGLDLLDVLPDKGGVVYCMTPRLKEG